MVVDWFFPELFRTLMVARLLFHLVVTALDAVVVLLLVASISHLLGLSMIVRRHLDT